MNIVQAWRDCKADVNRLYHVVREIVLAEQNAIRKECGQDVTLASFQVGNVAFRGDGETFVVREGYISRTWIGGKITSHWHGTLADWRFARDTLQTITAEEIRASLEAWLAEQSGGAVKATNVW